MYFRPEAWVSAPSRVRAPKQTSPCAGKERMTSRPIGFSNLCLRSSRGIPDEVTPIGTASVPARSFHTPRCASVRTKSPHGAREGAKERGRKSSANGEQVRHAVGRLSVGNEAAERRSNSTKESTRVQLPSGPAQPAPTEAAMAIGACAMARTPDEGSTV